MHTYNYTKVRENIWQIGEEDGVCCTLIRGRKLAVLVDTGYGNWDLRSFVEETVSTPYIVINSHGHPDHIGGNHWFDSVFLSPEDRKTMEYFQESAKSDCSVKDILPGEIFDLGGLHLDVVSLAGHTRGSIGLLVREARLLVAGDALNDQLWLFNFGSLSMGELRDTLERTLPLPFDTYLAGHSDREYPKSFLHTHIRNIDTLNLEACTKQDTLGFETYLSSYTDETGTSLLVFTADKL